MKNQIEKIKLRYKSLEPNDKKKVIMVSYFLLAIFFIVLVWNVVFDWSASVNIPFKTGTYQINHLGKNVNIDITKIDYQVFKKVNGKIVYPHNGLYVTIHYVVKNNTREEITYSNDSPFISTNGSKYLPINPVSRESIQPASSASDIVAFDLPYKVNGLFIEAVEYYHDFIFTKSFVLSI